MTSRPHTWTVDVCDNSHRGDETNGHPIAGLATFEQAREYARRRVRDSREELREPGMEREDCAAGGACSGGFSRVATGSEGRSNRALDEIGSSLARTACPEDRDWQALAP